MPELDGHLDESVGQALIRLPRFGGKVRMNFGIATAVDTAEKSFLIDSDFYSDERTTTDAIYDTLNYFNKQSGRLFRWCVTDRLQDAMRPQPVDSAP